MLDNNAVVLELACLIISEQGFSNEIQHPFLFVADRNNKGLKPSLGNVLPRNKESIETNICQSFGQECARYVMPIAKVSFRYSNHLT
jgi:hypothetical protein